MYDGDGEWFFVFEYVVFFLVCVLNYVVLYF